MGVNDAMTMILWMKRFIEAQGYPVIENVIYQDNESSMKLEKYGRQSSSKKDTSPGHTVLFRHRQCKERSGADSLLSYWRYDRRFLQASTGHFIQKIPGPNFEPRRGLPLIPRPRRPGRC